MRRIADFLRDDILGQGSWLFSAVMTTLVFLLCNHALVLGRAVGRWDVDGQYMQYYVLVCDFFRAGRLLYWDPWTNGGIPLMGDPQVGAFSPVTLVLGWVLGGSPSSFVKYWLFMWWLGGMGMLLMARHLKAPPWGAFLVSVSFLFCGVYTGHAEHTSIVISFSALPWVVWRLDKSLKTRNLLPALQAGAIWGASALCGYPALTLITGCFCALWGLGRLVMPDEPRTGGVPGGIPSQEMRGKQRKVGFLIAALTVMAVVGVLVLLPTYFSFLVEGAGHHTRVGVVEKEEAVWANALHPGAVATFSSNFLSILQMNNPDSLWPYTDVSMSSIYGGAFMTLLAVFALAAAPRNRWRWWLAFMGIMALACAMGKALPLRSWLYDWFYPMRFFRHAALFRAYYLFALSVLALYGIRILADAIRQGDGAPWKRLFHVALVLTPLAIVTYIAIWMPLPNRYGTEDVSAVLHLLFVWGGAVGLIQVCRRYGDAPCRWAAVILLSVLVSVDAFVCADLAKRTILDHRFLERWKDLDRMHSRSIDLTANGLRREESAFNRHSPKKQLNNDQMITKVPVFNAYATEINDFHLAMAANPRLRSLATGTNRIWFSPVAMEVPPVRKVFEAWEGLASQDLPPLVIHDRQALMKGQPGLTREDGSWVDTMRMLPPVKSVSIENLQYGPDEMAFLVECPEDGWLLVTDRWAKNWSVEVNSREETVYGADFIFRAVKVSKGPNAIRFTYRPLGLPWLVYLSWGTLASACIASLPFAHRAAAPRV